MTDAVAYIATARKLLAGQPTDADIRRAVSTTYYALFHHVCFHFSMIVLHPSTGTYRRAWLQAYRYLDHGAAKQRCQDVNKKDRKFSLGILVFSEAFVDLQQRRNDADYNPSIRFSISDAVASIGDAQKAINAFNAEPLEAQRAFVIFVGLRAKNR